jgi:mannan endo-1,4-beta-mannosidase
LKNQILLLLIFISIGSIALAQNNFVTVDNSRFEFGGQQFRFLGANATYLYQQAAYGRHFIVDEVFSDLRRMKVKVVRIGAHFESDNLLDPAVIMTAPNEYNESALRALDYVLMKAKEYQLKLVLILTNNWKHYGGIPQYIKWANTQKILNRTFEHDDFYINETIKSWYMNYLAVLINRTNTFTSVKYKDDSTIFSWELINEPRSKDKSGMLIYNWLIEMLFFVKSQDSNHMVGTGEEGMDISPNFYPSYDYFYNGREDLFDGSYGISFRMNSSISMLDYISIHLYPEAWGFNDEAGINWLRDHIRISQLSKKPILIGEFGSKSKNVTLINKWLEVIKKSLNGESMIWQYSHPSLDHKDGFGFNWVNDSELCSSLQNYAESLETFVQPELNLTRPELAQNYPNPFNEVTNVEIKLPSNSEALLYVSDILGQIKLIVKEGYLTKGKHHFVFSMDRNVFSSGVYLYTLEFNGQIQTKKMIYLK